MEDHAAPISPSDANLERFYRAVARLRAGDDDATWLAEALADLHARGALDGPLQLPPRAPPPVSCRARLRERNSALRRWADTIRAPSVRAFADDMAQALRAFASTAAYHRHLASGVRPADKNGFAFDVLRHNHSQSIAANTIRTIISAKNGPTSRGFRL